MKKILLAILLVLASVSCFGLSQQVINVNGNTGSI